MQAAYCSLYCALELIPSTDSILVDARFHLLECISLSKEYSRLWNSIYWNGSRACVKRNMKQRLNHVAFDAYSSLLECGKCLDKYQAQYILLHGNHPPVWWNRMMFQLNRGAELMHREHREQIYKRQLNLI